MTFDFVNTILSYYKLNKNSYHYSVVNRYSNFFLINRCINDKILHYSEHNFNRYGQFFFFFCHENNNINGIF